MFAQAATDTGVVHVWHYWLGAALSIGAVLLILTIAVLYFVRVTRTRYPNKPS